MSSFNQEFQILLTGRFIFNENQENMQTKCCKSLQFSMLINSRHVRNSITSDIVRKYRINQGDEQILAVLRALAGEIRGKRIQHCQIIISSIVQRLREDHSQQPQQRNPVLRILRLVVVRRIDDGHARFPHELFVDNCNVSEK